MLKLLNDYVDGAIDPAVCADFEKHLAGCNPCTIVVDNIRRTITLYKGRERFEIPVDFRDRLHQALRDKWKTR
jgi:anti-sigma factor RsiW